jgi:hypothetical protein
MRFKLHRQPLGTGTFPEPSAVAPDAKVYVNNNLGNTLNTQFDF